MVVVVNIIWIIYRDWLTFVDCWVQIGSIGNLLIIAWTIRWDWSLNLEVCTVLVDWSILNRGCCIMKATKPTSFHPNPPHLWRLALCVVSLKLLATPLLLSTVLPSLTWWTRLITSEHFPSLSLVWIFLLLFSQWGHCVLFSLGEGYLSLLLSSIVLLLF